MVIGCYIGEKQQSRDNLEGQRKESHDGKVASANVQTCKHINADIPARFTKATKYDIDDVVTPAMMSKS